MCACKLKCTEYSQEHCGGTELEETHTTANVSGQHVIVSQCCFKVDSAEH